MFSQISFVFVLHLLHLFKVVKVKINLFYKIYLYFPLWFLLLALYLSTRIVPCFSHQIVVCASPHNIKQLLRSETYIIYQMLWYICIISGNYLLSCFSISVTAPLGFNYCALLYVCAIVHNYLKYIWIWFVKIFVGMFASIFIKDEMLSLSNLLLEKC